MIKATVHSLYRYPVKGMSPERIDSARLEAGSHFPGDRMFAVENGPSGFDPRAAEHLPKMRFLVLMRNEKLAKLRTRFDDATGMLTISQGGLALAVGDLGTESGRSVIEAFLDRYFAGELRGPTKVLPGPPGYRFMDSRSGYLSIIDLASVDAIAAAAGRHSIDPLRFRANVHVTGLGAWGELALVGKRMRLGEATIEIIKRIDRCAATDVDPTLGIRDMRNVEMMERVFGHHDCGVYARIVSAGTIEQGSILCEPE
jgi:uncharacterized protein